MTGHHFAGYSNRFWQLLADSGLTIADFELVEVNEAFAAQYLGCEKELGLSDEHEGISPRYGTRGMGMPPLPCPRPQGRGR